MIGVYPYATSTAGQPEDMIKLLTAIGRGVRGVEKDGTTAGEIDVDYLTIKASASVTNLTEEEAYDLIDKIRSELPINQ